MDMKQITKQNLSQFFPCLWFLNQSLCDYPMKCVHISSGISILFHSVMQLPLHLHNKISSLQSWIVQSGIRKALQVP